MRPRLLDLVLFALAALIDFANVIDNGASPAGLGLTAVACAALLARRKAPLPMLALTLAAELGADAVGDFPAGAPILVMLFTVADELEARIAVAALVPCVIVLGLGDITSPVTAASVWLAGTLVRMRRVGIEEDEQRAVQREREAIARELHDVIAHSVSVMLVGVRGARDVLRSQPDVADETLAKVEASGEQSLAELRRALGLLRGSDAVPDRRPQPTLAQLDELLAEASLPAHLEVVGERRPLPTGVELSAYRIIQEALTNVRKHAHATMVTVRLTYGETLTIEVFDDGRGDGGGAGRGLLGMRERAALHGGHVVTESETGRGFRLRATLPAG